MFSASTNAQIVYTDVVPDTTASCSTSPCFKSYNIDLNNDGTTDFTLHTYSNEFVCGNFGVPLKIRQVHVNSRSGNRTDTLMLNASDTIGSNLAFSTDTLLRKTVVNCTPGPLNASYGNWSNSSDHYLGLRLAVGGNIYYGWARLNVATISGPVYFTVKDYAYNTVANAFILAGQTIATGITENSFASSINLFPNPATNHFTIALGSKNKKVEVKITDISGKVIPIAIVTTTSKDPDSYREQKVEVDTKDFAAGIYIVQIQGVDFMENKILVVNK
jgi:hypothetical protein